MDTPTRNNSFSQATGPSLRCYRNQSSWSQLAHQNYVEGWVVFHHHFFKHFFSI